MKCLHMKIFELKLQEELTMKQKMIILFCTGIIALGGCAPKLQEQTSTQQSDEIASTELIKDKSSESTGNKSATQQSSESSKDKSQQSPVSSESKSFAQQTPESSEDKSQQSPEPSEHAPVIDQSTKTSEEPSVDNEQADTKNTESETPHNDAETPSKNESSLDTVYVGEYLETDVNEPNLEIAKGDDGKYIVQIGIYRLTSLSDGIGELTAQGMNFTATDSSGNPISGVITADGQTATVTFTNSTWEYLENGSSFQYTKSSDIPNIWNE